MDLKIVAISGCLSKKSVSSGLIRACLQTQHPHLRIQIADISEFPLVNPDIIAEKGFPEVVNKVRKMVSEADGVIVAFPNHNDLISAVMKNAYDWISINDGSCPIKQKPFALMSSSQYGSTKALDNFKRVGGYCKIKVCDKFVNILGEKENNFDQKGNIVNEEIMAEIKQFLESFYQMILSEKK